MCDLIVSKTAADKLSQMLIDNPLSLVSSVPSTRKKTSKKISYVKLLDDVKAALSAVVNCLNLQTILTCVLSICWDHVVVPLIHFFLIVGDIVPHLITFLCPTVCLMKYVLLKLLICVLKTHLITSLL